MADNEFEELEESEELESQTKKEKELADSSEEELDNPWEELPTDEDMLDEGETEI